MNYGVAYGTGARRFARVSGRAEEEPAIHEKATREKRTRVAARTLIGRSYRACRGPHQNETITVTGLAEVTEGDR